MLLNISGLTCPPHHLLHRCPSIRGPVQVCIRSALEATGLSVLVLYCLPKVLCFTLINMSLIKYS
jgi:hypothetical protein